MTGISVKNVGGSPASSRSTFQFATSDNLFATTDPAEPEPTTIKSYLSVMGADGPNRIGGVSLNGVRFQIGNRSYRR